MEEENNRSSLEEMPERNPKPPDEDYQGERFEKNVEQRRILRGNNSSDHCISTGERGESIASQSEILTSLQKSDYSEVPVECSQQPLQSVGKVKLQDQSNSQLLPTSVTQSVSSILSPALPEKDSQSVENQAILCLKEQNKNSKDVKPMPIVSKLKNPDGYNWRKYGQKQAKSPEGSRSYYRCTFSNCNAKKIECSDRYNRVIETVYRSHHNHDPPQKIICGAHSRPAPNVPVNGSDDLITHPVRSFNDPVPSTSSKEPLLVIDQIPETKHQDSCGSDETTDTNFKEEVDGPEYKRRQKRSSTGEPDSIPRNGKKPKFLVYEAVDVSISGDGYRWRKYGQKMVKGNPHPRNYYRCTSAGCPVRKHIETAVDNTSAIVITYKGVHDHDMPIPKKRHGPKSAPRASAYTRVSKDNLQINKAEPDPSQTQQSSDKKCESNLGGERTSESARTLLSIEFEIKPF